MPYTPDDAFPVNTTTQGAQDEPKVTYLSSGGFVIVWSDRSQSATQGTDLRGQAYDAAGAAVGDEFLIAGAVGDQTDAAVAQLPGGGFIVVWFDSFAGQVRAQIFDPDGDKIGAEIPVSDPGRVSTTPDVVALESGNVVIVWKQQVASFDPVTPGIVAQQFDATGARVGPLAGIEDYHGEFPQVAAMQGGGFVVSYIFNSPFEDYPTNVQSHVYDSDSARLDGGGGSGQVNSPGRLQPDDHSVAGLDNGGYVIAWAAMTDGSDSAPDMIFAQLFDAVGDRIGSPFEVNSTTGGLVEHQPAVVVVPGLGFAVAWRDSGESGGGANAAVRVQLFTDDGVRIGGEFAVDDGGGEPHLAANADGELIVSWADGDILARIYFPEVHAGGPGNDVYIVDDLTERVIEAPGEGYDTIYSRADYRLGDDSEVEGLSTITWEATDPINLTGNGLANYLIGNAGANRLNGAGGDDVMYGREGDDSYVVDSAGDRVFESAGQGSDIVYTSVSYALAADSDVEALATIKSTATDAINLTGNGLANTLTGNAGRNQLDGKAGADTMYGGRGKDTYLVDNAGDKPIEVAGEGVDDIVYTSVSYALAADTDIEGLATISFQATTAINLTGNGLANQIIGNDGANQLDGKGGADTMTGRAGNDKYFVDNALDRAFEAAGGGTDVVYTAVSFVLTDGQEIEGLSTITWELTNAINLTGNSLNNNLIGNAGVNVLDGKGGNDTLQGREGADSYAFTTALGANNIDVIFGFSSADDTIVLENNGVFVGLGGGVLNGNAFVIGTAAQDSSDRIIYDQATGRLFFDADGTGAGAQVQFAVLNGAPIIQANDFTVI